jgi:hypothetical protein
MASPPGNLKRKRADLDVVSTNRTDADVGTSDHDWVIADINNPK